MAEEKKRYTDEEIDALYQEERKRRTNKILMIVVVVACLYGFGMIFIAFMSVGSKILPKLGGIGMFARMFMPLFFFVPFAIGFTVLKSVWKKNRYTGIKSVLKEIVIPYCVEDMFGEGATFDANGYVPEGELKAKELLGFSWDGGRTSNLIRGRYNGLNFTFADVRFYNERTYEDKNGDKRTEETTVFEGPWAIIDFNNKKLNENIIVRECDEKTKVKHKDEKILVELENVVFNNKFNVFSKDPHGVFYLLTPQMMEHLMETEKTFAGWIYFGFIDGKIYIAIHTGNSSLGGISLANGVANARPVIYQKLGLVPGLIEKLQL